MTAEQIKALISEKIAGQGSMVDAGGALPAILDAIVDAIDAITPGEILSFAEPLKKSGTDVSLQIGGGLEKDADDALAVKLAEKGGLQVSGTGIKLSSDFVADWPGPKSLTYDEALALSNCPFVRLGNGQILHLIEAQASFSMVSAVIQDVDTFWGLWGTDCTFDDSGVPEGGNFVALYEVAGSGGYAASEVIEQ